MQLLDAPFFTVGEVARILKLNAITIYDYIRTGRLSAVRFGRYYRIAKSDLLDFLETQKVKL